MTINKIYNKGCIEGLKNLPSKSVNTCISSPPYWALRDYGVDGQIGLEATPEMFIEKMVEVYREVKRVLKDDGTCWINIGDTYFGCGFGVEDLTEEEFKAKYPKQATNKGAGGSPTLRKKMNGLRKCKVDGLKAKDLIGIPWMLAFALRKDGWYLRQDIIWEKPNAMPESVTDRCAKSHEYIFLLSKSSRYYFDNEAIKKDASPKTNARVSKKVMRNPRPLIDVKGGNQGNGGIPYVSKMQPAGQGNRNNPSFNSHLIQVMKKVNKRSVWTVPNKPFKEAHFATFPEKLIEDCIKAGCAENGIVLDPFMGAGTTAVVARKLNRNYIGFELNPEYIKIAESRLSKQLGMFK